MSAVELAARRQKVREIVHKFVGPLLSDCLSHKVTNDLPVRRAISSLSAAADVEGESMVSVKLRLDELQRGVGLGPLLTKTPSSHVRRLLEFSYLDSDRQYQPITMIMFVMHSVL